MINIIPLPRYYSQKNGFFVIDGKLGLSSDFELDMLDKSLFETESGAQKRLCIIKDSSLGGEEYTVEVTENVITVKASGETGAYYALQSLRQLSGYELGKRELPCCVIKDKPEYKWRGLQLDESRHFFGKEEVKRLLDEMFMMKLNVFHWHLTDDQGWRIEIKKYPLLTQIGSVREYTHINGWGSTDIINEKHSGYYTHEDIKEIVEYAAKRGITVVPEIDFPAHCASAMAAYPWIACRELKREVPGYFGSSIPEKKLNIKDWNRTLCLGNDKVIEFVLDIVDEVCALFPSEYFHIGGDEAPKNEWEKCPLCQKRISDEGLKNEDDLQGWFNSVVRDRLEEKGKQLIGWNEILKADNIGKTVIAQYWTARRDKRAVDYVNGGGKIIISKHQSFYFDMPYGKYPLKNTYDFSPEKLGITPEGEKNILGVEGESWTEWIDGTEKLELNLHPRLQALSETAWTEPKQKDWQNFKMRLDAFKPFYDYFGINYAVDKVTQPKNRLTGLHIERYFMKGDTHMEVALNKKYKSQGEK